MNASGFAEGKTLKRLKYFITANAHSTNSNCSTKIMNES